MNRLYYGDNKSIMLNNMASNSVDLIYLDPPFKSNQNYNLMYKTLTGKPVPEQAQAFCDTWEMDAEKENLAKTMPVLMREHGIEEYYVDFWRIWVTALRNTQPHLLAYLLYMVERLLHMKSILKSTGSIYLHCDPEASHYIKVMMDGIFKHQNFRNEIVWKRTYAHGGASRWGDIHDTILFYTASENYTWNQEIKQALDPNYVDDKYKFEDKKGRYQFIVMTGPGTTQGDSGKPWQSYNPTQAGRHWAVPRRAIKELRDAGVEIPKKLRDQLDLLLEHGYIQIPKGRGGKPGVPRYKLYLTGTQPLQDIILDIPPVNSQAKVRLGYPTQKPIPLLKRIIEASSKKGDVVFDPFCGCGTTIYAAHETGRQWIGCDIAILAIGLVRDILSERYRQAEGRNYVVDGIPVSVEQALDLFQREPHDFQSWAVEHAGGFPTIKRTDDKGIDGRIYFEIPGEDAYSSMVISVKGGNIQPRDIRELRGVLDRDGNGVKLAGFISNKPATKRMKEEAASGGVFEYEGVTYPRIQLLNTVEMLEEKKRFQTPTKVRSKISTGQIPLGV